MLSAYQQKFLLRGAGLLIVVKCALCREHRVGLVAAQSLPGVICERGGAGLRKSQSGASGSHQNNADGDMVSVLSLWPLKSFRSHRGQLLLVPGPQTPMILS